MSYDHRMNPMYEHSSCMIFVLSCMINVDHGLYHDPYDGHLGPEGGYFEDALDGEHGGEDQVEVGENVREFQRRPLEL